MAFTYGFYNSKGGDRKYNADQMGNLFDGILNDGVFDNVGNIFATVPGEGLQVLVKSGRAWFNKTWSYNDAAYPIYLERPDVAVPRIDAIVLEVDRRETHRRNRIGYIVGIPDSTPKKPTLTNTDLIHQHPLAYVTVRAGTESILHSDIEIRVGQSDCPFVTGILKTASIDDLFAAWNEQFTTWFEGVRSQLEGDVAANLLREIQLRLPIADKATSSEVGAGTVDNKYITPKQLAPHLGKIKDAATGSIISPRIRYPFISRYNVIYSTNTLYEWVFDASRDYLIHGDQVMIKESDKSITADFTKSQGSSRPNGLPSNKLLPCYPSYKYSLNYDENKDMAEMRSIGENTYIIPVYDAFVLLWNTTVSHATTITMFWGNYAYEAVADASNATTVYYIFKDQSTSKFFMYTLNLRTRYTSESSMSKRSFDGVASLFANVQDRLILLTATSSTIYALYKTATNIMRYIKISTTNGNYSEIWSKTLSSSTSISVHLIHRNGRITAVCVGGFGHPLILSNDEAGNSNLSKFSSEYTSGYSGANYMTTVNGHDFYCSTSTDMMSILIMEYNGDAFVKSTIARSEVALPNTNVNMYTYHNTYNSTRILPLRYCAGYVDMVDKKVILPITTNLGKNQMMNIVGHDTDRYARIDNTIVSADIPPVLST